MYVPQGKLVKPPPTEPLRTNVLFSHIQTLLSADTAVIAETGDSWFNCLKLRLPPGCGYEFQMQYGSIGWSVGAVLGYATAVKPKGRRVVAMIGDGSFQMTAQEVSTMIRYDQVRLDDYVMNDTLLDPSFRHSIDLQVLLTHTQRSPLIHFPQSQNPIIFLINNKGYTIEVEVSWAALLGIGRGCLSIRLRCLGDGRGNCIDVLTIFVYFDRSTTGRTT